MKERPILFTPDNVRAILDGRKTQTRRVVKPTQSTPKVAPLRMEPWLVDGEQQTDDNGYPCWAGFHPDYPDEAKWFSCPYGGPGDRLWVREAFAETGLSAMPVAYKADDNWATISRYRSPFHMPRWASRITLEITDVRVEQVQAISEADAEAEGVELLPCTYVGQCHSNSCPRHGRLDRYRLAYSKLWDSINGKKHPWDSNPWVWAISFKRVQL